MCPVEWWGVIMVIPRLDLLLNLYDDLFNLLFRLSLHATSFSAYRRY